MEREPLDERSWMPPPDPTRDVHSAWDTPEPAPPAPHAPVSATGSAVTYGPPPPPASSCVSPALGQWSTSAPPTWAPPPKTHVAWSIFAMLCFLPFGIVSLVKGSSVKFLWAQGRRAEAQAASTSALMWALWSLVMPPILFFGLVGVVLWIVSHRM